MSQTTSSRKPDAPPRSMADAIARAKAAASAADRQRAAGVRPGPGHQRIFHTDLNVPKTRDARRVRNVAIGATVLGTLMIVVLPDTFAFHWLAFAALFALIFIGVPNFLLDERGALAVPKVVGWTAVLLFMGAMTTVATGTTGNLWSWAPWLQSLYHPGVAAPHP